MVNSFWVASIAGISCGVLSVSLDQRLAQGINLLYFIPTAAGAFFFHWKQKTIAWKAVLPAVIAGCCTAIAAACLAGSIHVDSLRKLFGIFLLIVGMKELRK